MYTHTQIHTHTHHFFHSSIVCMYVCIHTHTYTQWNTTQPEKGEFATCKNIDGPREYYA